MNFITMALCASPFVLVIGAAYYFVKGRVNDWDDERSANQTIKRVLGED